MPGFQRSGLLFAAGGDVFAKYGTFTRRYQIPQLSGEGTKEVFARAGTAWAIGRNGLLVPHQANAPRLEYVADPVNLVQQPYWLLEGPGTNLIENADCEVDVVGWNGANGGETIVRDNTAAFSGAWSCKVTTQNVGGSGCWWSPRAGGRLAAAAATIYTVSVNVWLPVGSAA